MVREIVDYLKSVRSKKRITHKELSRLSGISQKHISNIENYKTVPSIETLKKLANGLGVEISLELKASGE